MITLADFWLHLVTKSVFINQPVPTIGNPNAFGRSFPTEAFGSAFTSTVASSYAVSAFNENSIQKNASEAMMVLKNSSSESQVMTTIFDNVQYALIADVELSRDIDFIANTYASSVSCEAITPQCDLDLLLPPPGAIEYNCSTGFAGNLTSDNFFGNYGYEWAVYPNASLEVPYSRSSVSSTPPANPFYYVTVAHIVVNSYQSDDTLFNDPNFVPLREFEYGIAMSCRVDIHKLQYTYSNGVIVNISATPANATEAGLFLADVLLTDWTYLDFADTLFTVGSVVNNTLQQFLDSIGSNFAKLVAAGPSGIMLKEDNIVQQAHKQMLVTRMPRAPLWTLIALNGAYLAFGTLLVIVVVASRPTQGYEVKRHLKVSGIVASSFEASRNSTVATAAAAEKAQPFDFFAESKGPGHSSRVGIILNKSSALWQKIENKM
jgi:hypothetical protein